MKELAKVNEAPSAKKRGQKSGHSSSKGFFEDTDDFHLIYLIITVNDFTSPPGITY